MMALPEELHTVSLQAALMAVMMEQSRWMTVLMMKKMCPRRDILA
jgi:hypothetical protein